MTNVLPFSPPHVNGNGNGQALVDHADFLLFQCLDQQGKVVPGRLGELLEREGHLKLGTDGRLWRYRGGVYVDDGQAWARARIREILGPERFRNHLVNEALGFVQASLPSLPDAHPGVINVANGVLDWRTLELRPHSPEHAGTVQLPIAWNPQGPCPQIHKFLEEVLPGNAVELMLELVGMTLLPANPFQKAVLLWGPGANGKTTWLSTMRALLGEQNVASVGLQALAGDNRFAVASLQGKLANLAGDLDSRFTIKNTGLLKQLVGGDTIYAERKYQEGFHFVNYATPWFACNSLPTVEDHSEGWARRWVVIPMVARLAGREDPDMSRLTAPGELEGLLVLAVTGLHRLMERRKLLLPESVKRATAQFAGRWGTNDS